MVIRPAHPLYQSSEGFHATNNPFQTDGPKGFTEMKLLENEDLFVRTDLPGSGLGRFSVFVDDSKKAVTIKTFAPMLNVNDSSPRSYSTTTELVCDCCEISSFTHQLSDGVLRLLISKTPIDIPHRSSATCAGPSSREETPVPCSQRSVRVTDPNDPALTGRIFQPHPFVSQGSFTAYEFKQLPDGSLYVRLDMPGVPKDNFTVFTEIDRVKVIGHAPAVSHDSGGRNYSADAALLTVPVGQFPRPSLKTIAENGVIRLLIGPKH